MGMEITSAYNFVEVVLSGRISEQEADRVKEVLKMNIANEETIYHVDFSNVDNISFAGIGVLTVMQKLALNKFGCFFVKGLTGKAKNRFEVLQLDKVFELH